MSQTAITREIPARTSRKPWLSQVVRQLGSAFRVALDDSRLTVTQLSVLEALAHNPGQSASDLARLGLVSSQAMGAMLASMLDAGLITRTVHPDHARIIQTHLTPRGHDALRAASAEIARVEQALLADLRGEERRALRALLDRCVARVRSDL